MIHPFILILLAGALLAGITIWAALFHVQPRTTAIVCRRGHFARQVGPGLRIKLPWVERVVGTIAHDARVIDVTLVVQTLDPIEIRLAVAVEYFVLAGRAHDVFFDRSNVANQIGCAVRVAARSYIPELKLASLLAGNEEVAVGLRQRLDHALRGLGYGLRTVVILGVEIEDDSEAPELLPAPFGAGWKGTRALAGATP